MLTLDFKIKTQKRGLTEKVVTNLTFISRLRLHDGKLIKDRRYHLRTYPNCFVAQEVIDWLVSHKEAPDRGTATCLLQHLMDHDIVHHGEKEAVTVSVRRHWRDCDSLKRLIHLNCLSSVLVCDKRPVFKDAKLLYRFRKDDGTFPFNTEVKTFMRGQQLYEQ